MARGPEDYGIIGTLTASGQSAPLALGFGESVVAVQIAGTFVGTCVFEASQDPLAGLGAVSDANAQWNPVNCIAQPGVTTNGSATAPGNYFFLAGGYTRFRVRCSAYTSGTVTVSLSASTANATYSGVMASTVPAGVSIFTGTSPAAPGTVLQTAVLNLDAFSKCVISARLNSGAGGTLDVYIQSYVNNGASWYDVAHFPQVAAGAGAFSYIISLTRGETYNTTTPVVVNNVDGTPTLAANTVIPHALGNALRVVFVAGAGTSAGGTQTIVMLPSTQ